MKWCNVFNLPCEDAVQECNDPFDCDECMQMDEQTEPTTNELTLNQLRTRIGHNVTAVKKSDKSVKSGTLHRIDPIDIDNVMVYADGFAELFHENSFYDTEPKGAADE